MNGKPFAKGHDPRRGNGGVRMRTSKLRKALMQFDERAWQTLADLFASEQTDHRIEGLKLWARYRLSCLLPRPEAQPEAAVGGPRLSPEMAKAIAEVAAGQRIEAPKPKEHDDA